MLKPEIGKIYQHQRGGIVQIIKTFPMVEAYALHLNFTCLIKDFTWQHWERSCQILPDHPKMLIPCIDCQKFCNQQCKLAQ